jgi:hypothetical protein
MAVAAELLLVEQWQEREHLHHVHADLSSRYPQVDY